MTDSSLSSGRRAVAQRQWWETVLLIMHEAIQEGSPLFNEKKYKAALKVFKDAAKRAVSHANGEVLRRLEEGLKQAKSCKFHIVAGIHKCNPSLQAWSIRNSFEECQWMLMPGGGIVPAREATSEWTAEPMMATAVVGSAAVSEPVAGLVLNMDGEEGAGVAVRRAPTEWAKRKMSQAIEHADPLFNEGQVTECMKVYEQCCRKIAGEAGDPGEQLVRDILRRNDPIIRDRSWALRSLLQYLLLCRTGPPSESTSPASLTPAYQSSTESSPLATAPATPRATARSTPRRHSPERRKLFGILSR